MAGSPAARPWWSSRHVPLWAVYPQWGWGTDDAEQALAYLKRFGSVTVLNGHIHQICRRWRATHLPHRALDRLPAAARRRPVAGSR